MSGEKDVSVQDNFIKRLLTDLAILLVLAVVYIAIYRTCGFYYAINDDITMQRLASGSITGTPDAHLIFIRYPLGVFISGLFKLFPQYDWYGLTLTGLMFLCYFLIARRIFSVTRGRSGRWWMRIAGIVLLALLIMDCSILFQFTVVAGVLALTAIFYLASADRETVFSSYLLAWILLLLSCLVRFKVFYMSVPLAGLIIFGKLIETLKYRGRWPRGREWSERFRARAKLWIGVLVVTIAGLAAFFAIVRVEKKAYAASPWKEYTEYKHARSLITDYYNWPSYDENKGFWDSMEISREQYDCLRMYGILPEMSAETIVSIGDYAEKIYYKPFSERLADMGRIFIDSACNKSCRMVNILLVVALLLLVLYLIRADGFDRLMICACILAEAGILAYLLYQGRLPVRIIAIYNYQCIMAITGFLLVRHRSAGSSLRAVCIVWIVCGLVLLYFMAGQEKAEVEKYRENIAVYEEVQAYVGSWPDRFFVVQTGTSSTVKKFTLEEKGNEISNKTGTYGWSVYSPWDTKALSDYGLDRTDNILMQPEVYMLTTSLDEAKKLRQYYRSEGLKGADFEVVESRELSNGRPLRTLKWNSAASIENEAEE